MSALRASGEPGISIVIPTHERPHHIEVTLRALLAQEIAPESMEIIVVSDAPNAATKAIVETIAAEARSRVRYYQQSKAGQGSARNVGIREARGRIVLMLDDDVSASSRLVATHLAAHEGHDDVIAVGALPVERRDPEPPHHRIVREWWDSEQLRMAAPGYEGSFRDFVTGNVSVPRARLLEVGGFDPDFTGYGREDYELGFRLSKLGMRYVFLPQAVAVHRYRKEPLEWLRQFYAIGKADVIFARKHPERILEVMNLSAVPRMSWSDAQIARAERIAVLLGAWGGRIWEALAARVQGAHYWRGVRDAAADEAELQWVTSVYERLRRPGDGIRLAPPAHATAPALPFPTQVRSLASHRAAPKVTRVSVVIPVYNQSRYVTDAIESVKAQSRSAAEILVIDDGSTDDSGDVAVRAGARCIRQSNRGLAAARNAGLLAASGEYIVFLDADDRLLPDALARGLACSTEENDAPAFVAGGYQIIDESGAFVRPSRKPVVTSEHYMHLLESNFIAMHGAVMYHRELLAAVGGFDETLPSCEDYDVYLRIARWLPIRCHDSVVAEYRLHKANMSHDNARMLEGALRVLDRHGPQPESDPRLEQARQRGIALYREYYGEPLLRDLSKHIRDASAMLAAARDIRVLARRYPEGLAKHARGRIPLLRRAAREAL